MIALLRYQLNRLSANSRLVIWLLLLLMVTALGAVQLLQGAKVQSDILAMLPKIQEEPLTQRAINRVEQQLADRLYIALIVKTKAQAVTAAQQLIDALHRYPDIFTQVKSADIDSAQSLNQFYFPHRFKLLTEQQRTLIENGQISRLEANTVSQLYNAFGYANSSLLSQDPLLLYPDNLKALAPSQRLHSSQGILLTSVTDGSGNIKHAAIVMAKGIGSAFNPNVQQAQNTALENALSSVAAKLDQDAQLEVLKAGALFHASAATEQAKAEVSTLGLASLIGVIALVWFAFRSIFPLVIASLTIATSLLYATVSTLFIFGELHLLTLVFGTSLIGIAIDYSFHFYCERLSNTDDTATASVSHVFPAALLALLTTVLAYLGIGLTPFPGMQQVAVFCAAGLIGAFLTLVLAYPKLANSSLTPRPRPLNLATAYLTWLAKLNYAKQSPFVFATLATLSLATLIGLCQLDIDDDIRSLQQSPDKVLKQEQALRQLLSGGTDNQFLLVRGDTPQQLLQNLETLTTPLNKLKQDGVIGNAINLASYIPSHARQQDNYQLQGLIYSQIDNSLSRLGLDETLALEIKRQYAQSQDRFIEPVAFLNSPAGRLFTPLWLAPKDNEHQYGAIVLLGGIKDLNQLQTIITPIAHTQLIDKVADISEVMAKYRSLTLGLLVLALLIAGAIFSLRFGFKLAMRVTAVPTLAAIMTLAMLGLFDSPLTLFHALALILVFGIGVDYSLFFAESKQGSGVMMAVFMSACSTLMAFGLLAFSQTPAIHYFGLTLLLGIAVTFLLSPLIYTFTRIDK
ncbi:MMPL family transporter [Shewanella psychrotolerans]|uniref:MMPL family transporter n=1 Tax=Shewanella psychrotolerans TaxID=2864206 RepID=UPI001C65F8C3|nr:transporter permease [Shewanella psychrotolerans]QYK01704.1 transporter permease [Shewanella psychrotolerans]